MAFIYKALYILRSFRYFQSCLESSQQPCFLKCGNESLREAIQLPFHPAGKWGSWELHWSLWSQSPFCPLHQASFLHLFQNLLEASYASDAVLRVKTDIITCLWWVLVRRWRWRNRSQSVQRFPHTLHKMIAAVSPSSWLSHIG